MKNKLNTYNKTKSLSTIAKNNSLKNNIIKAKNINKAMSKEKYISNTNNITSQPHSNSTTNKSNQNNKEEIKLTNNYLTLHNQLLECTDIISASQGLLDNISSIQSHIKSYKEEYKIKKDSDSDNSVENVSKHSNSSSNDKKGISNDNRNNINKNNYNDSFNTYKNSNDTNTNTNINKALVSNKQYKENYFNDKSEVNKNNNDKNVNNNEDNYNKIINHYYSNSSDNNDKEFIPYSTRNNIKPILTNDMKDTNIQKSNNFNKSNSLLNSSKLNQTKKESNSSQVILPNISQSKIEINKQAHKEALTKKSNDNIEKKGNKYYNDYARDQIIKEIKEDNNKTSIYNNLYQKQINNYNSNAHKLSKLGLSKNNKNKNKTGSKKNKKDVFLTDIEIMQQYQNSLINISNKTKADDNSKNKININDEEDKSKYLASKETQIKEMFKYIDDSDDEKKDNKDTKDKEELDTLNKYDINLDYRDTDTTQTKQDKDFFKDMFIQIDTLRQLNKEKEDEIKALIRITKQTTDNLDKHFKGMQSLYTQAGIRYEDDIGEISNKKTIINDNQEDDMSDYEEYHRRAMGGGMMRNNGNINDDPKILKRNLNIIKDNLLNVTGNVLDYHKSFKNKISEMRKNNGGYVPESTIKKKKS